MKDEKKETIESLSVKLKASQTNNKRLRFELESEQRRYYQYKERIEYLERQNKTITDILDSVSKLLNIKVSEENIKLKLKEQEMR